MGRLRTGVRAAWPRSTSRRRVRVRWDHRLQLAGARSGRLHPRGAAVDRDGRRLLRRWTAGQVLQETGAEPGESRRDAAEDIVSERHASRDPVLCGKWLQAGALVSAVGANDPRRRELDNAVLERAAFVTCGSLEQAKDESGDLIEPVEAGVLDWLEVREPRRSSPASFPAARPRTTSSSSSRRGSRPGTWPSARSRSSAPASWALGPRSSSKASLAMPSSGRAGSAHVPV